jgi:hypothetical protein
MYDVQDNDSAIMNMLMTYIQSESKQEQQYQACNFMHVLGTDIANIDQQVENIITTTTTIYKKEPTGSSIKPAVIAPFTSLSNKIIKQLFNINDTTIAKARQFIVNQSNQCMSDDDSDNYNDNIDAGRKCKVTGNTYAYEYHKAKKYFERPQNSEVRGWTNDKTGIYTCIYKHSVTKYI